MTIPVAAPIPVINDNIMLEKTSFEVLYSFKYQSRNYCLKEPKDNDFMDRRDRPDLLGVLILWYIVYYRKKKVR